MNPVPAFLATQKLCHPERSPAASKANRQTQSKDPYHLDADGAESGNFSIAIGINDAQEAECIRITSREAAKECSPRRKPWVAEVKTYKPRRGERKCMGANGTLS